MRVHARIFALGLVAFVTSYAIVLTRLWWLGLWP